MIGGEGVGDGIILSGPASSAPLSGIFGAGCEFRPSSRRKLSSRVPLGEHIESSSIYSRVHGEPRSANIEIKDKIG